MHLEEAVAPSLSTAQDDSAFSYDKVVKSVTEERKHLNLKDPFDKDELISCIHNYYSLDKLVKELSVKDGETLKYKRVTLQFPDNLICDSSRIVEYLQQELSSEQKLYILADTSYSSCCIDEVAAEHVNSDLVVHFGDTCLNEVAKLAAFYVLGKPTVNLENILTQIREKFQEEDKVVLMANAPHTYVLHLLKQRLPNFENLIVADLIEPLSKSAIIDYTPMSNARFSTLNRSFPVDDDLSTYHLFHLTTPEAPRLLQLSTTFATVTTLDPSTGTLSQGPYPNLMRRYKHVHMVRSSGTIGILVNTLSLSNTKQLINTIKHKVKAAGKKHYIFVVGKPNVAKLANFESIDIWCILGCDHQGIIIDQTNEFFKPIITPYELLLGLSDELCWTGKWVTDYKSVINEYIQDDKLEQQVIENGNNSSDEEPEFDVVTGKYVNTARPLRQINHLMVESREQSEEEEEEEENSQLVQKFSNTVSIRNTVSTSAMHLQNRHWTGLGSDFKDDDHSEGNESRGEGAVVEQGRQGIARGYDYTS
ncbi:DPH2 [Candida oxycetoniae]|uniref:2-(3-amino-3-carboxypropyl)histidine synthase subunit 2 n=1 Tax=Candida oxycetoniae TaxID=497107 RepID=A0AAI9SUZ5_9ASCO|nr:DPH2 [Candida oxycetoniae]KAI3403402.2 DPH2 [Candida oxycetoniae]